MSARMSIRASTGESGLRVFPEVFRNRLMQLADETVESLQAIWNEAGYEEVERQSLLGDLLNKVKMTCSSELAAEQHILEHAKAQVATKLDQYRTMNKQLGRTPKDESNLGNNYTDKLAELEVLICSIQPEILQRQKLLNTEYAVIVKQATNLGETAPPENSPLFQGPDGTPHLSDAKLKVLKEYQQKLNQRKDQRLQEMLNVAEECRKHMTELVIDKEGWDTISAEAKYNDCNDALMMFLKSGDLNMGHSIKDLELLQSRCLSLSEEKERRREELASTGSEIARLWTLLRIPTAEREEFQKSFEMTLSMDTLARGREELERLAAVRASSLGRVIGSIRVDIAALWSEALMILPEDQRLADFPGYAVPVEQLSDSAVEEHEAYHSQLKHKVDELRPLLSKVARREVVVMERIELEHIQLNPERLTARGPNAREERKREEGMTVRVRNLDKMTKELLVQLSAWEEANGPFIYAASPDDPCLGMRYCDRVGEQDENYVEIRDSLRNARKRKDSKSDANSLTASKVPTRKASGSSASLQAAAASALSKSSSSSSCGLSASDLHTLNYNNGTGEQDFPDRHSSGSAESGVTSTTEVRERPSCATVIRNH